VERVRVAEEHFAGGPVERPKHWTGFTVKPIAFEFWLDRPNRLHDRRRFTLVDGAWQDMLLYP
jgi:pyridoxamine 5'-phosphate oxidase